MPTFRIITIAAGLTLMISGSALAQFTMGDRDYLYSQQLEQQRQIEEQQRQLDNLRRDQELARQQQEFYNDRQRQQQTQDEFERSMSRSYYGR